MDSGLILIDEFRFPHAVFPLNGTDLNAEGLKYGFNKIKDFLAFRQNSDAGLTIIVTPDWIFACLIY